MVKPIEPTPTLYDEDAEKLLAELKDVCSPEEAARRLRASREFLARVMKPRDWRQPALSSDEN